MLFITITIKIIFNDRFKLCLINSSKYFFFATSTATILFIPIFKSRPKEIIK